MAMTVYSSLPRTMGSSADATTSARIVAPTAGDVYMGRGNAHSWRPGNARFHRIVDQYSKLYHSTARKGSKGLVISQIYDSVNAKGRFLRDLEGGGYAEIDEEDAKRKIGQAMRYRNSKADSCQELTESSATDGSGSAVEARTGGSIGAALHEAVAEASAPDDNSSHGMEQEDPFPEEELFSESKLRSVLGASSQNMFFE
jgi:hypothetical protein